nr:hypothetical protein [Pseudomonas sp. s4]
MDGIQKSAFQRLEKSLGAAGFALENGGPAGFPVRIWVYSCAVSGGNVRQRASFQLSIDAFRAIDQRKDEVYLPLNEDEDSLLGALLLKYDDDTSSITEQEAQVVSLLLTRFVVSNGSIKIDDVNAGVHLIVVDSASGDFMKMSGFGIVGHRDILTSDELTESVEYFLQQVDLS